LKKSLRAVHVNLIGRMESSFCFTVIVELVDEDSQAKLYSREIGTPNPLCYCCIIVS
jgi:hypothetical protein